jgi:hypothetical protein
MPLLLFATRGFRNPDSVASFHSFEIKLSIKLTSEIRLFCQQNAIKEMHLGLAALQALLTQLTGTDDFVIALGCVLKDAADVMPVRFKGSMSHTGEELLRQTRNTIRDSHQYVHKSVKVLLKALKIGKQTLLHQVRYKWLLSTTNRPHNTDTYFKRAQDLVLLVREDNQRNLIVFVGVDRTLCDKEHAKTDVLKKDEDVVGRTTVQVGLVPHPHQNNTSILSFSTHDNSTTMAPIDKAIADLKLHEQDKDFSIQGIAKKYGVEYSTLRRRWTGQTGPRAAGYASQQLLSPQQEEGLVEYIGGLTARGLPPTRAMI